MKAVKKVAKKRAPKKVATTALVPVAAVPPVVVDKARAVSIVSEKEIIDGLDMLGITSKLDERQKRLFIAVAKMNNLNPLKRQIHAVAMWDADSGENKLVPVTGYEVYIDRAEESGRLQYWTVEESGSITDAAKGIGDYKATLIIKRKDWPREFTWTARYSEVVRKKKDGTTGRMWRERPTFMTNKVAMSQGFRLCFRDVLQGMPYTFDEMTEGEADIPRTSASISEPQPTAGVKVQENGKVEPPTENAELSKAVDAELKAARAELQAIFSKMAKAVANTKGEMVMLYKVEELNAMKEQAKAATADIAKLREYTIDWTAGYTEKLADLSLEGSK